MSFGQTMENHQLLSTGKPVFDPSGIRQDFDKLTREVLKATHELSFLQKQLPKAFSDYQQTVLPLFGKLRTVRKDFLMKLENLLITGSLSRYQKKTVIEYILSMVQKNMSADEDMKELYNRYSEALLVESTISNTSETAKDFADEGPFEAGTKEETEPWEKAKEEHRKKRQYRKKDEQAQQLKRSVKTVYTGLMKVFHPDTETDPDLKAQKEEISKKITVAYGNQDFFELLKLESEFLTTQKHRLSQLNDQQLRQYLDVLTEQKIELRKQVAQLKNDYGFLFDAISKGSEKQLKQLIKSEKLAIESHVSNYKSRIRILHDGEGAELKMLLEVLEEELDSIRFSQ